MTPTPGAGDGGDRDRDNDPTLSHEVRARLRERRRTQPETSGFAIASFVLGICAWFAVPVIGAVLAIIFGHMGRSEIARSRHNMGGEGLAICGLVLGYGQFVLGCCFFGAFI